MQKLEESLNQLFGCVSFLVDGQVGIYYTSIQSLTTLDNLLEYDREM